MLFRSLTKAEVRGLLEKLRPVVAKILGGARDIGQYSLEEVSKKTGIQRPHLSNLVHGREPLREVYLINLLAHNFITVDQLSSAANLTERERRALEFIKSVQDEELLSVMAFLRESGRSPKDMLMGMAVEAGYKKKK